MGYAKIKGKLMSRIGATVRYGAPKDVHKAGGNAVEGIIVDEVWADVEINDKPPRSANNKDDWGDYSFCAQRIKWNNDDYSIRLAYYRRRAGENCWEYASQMTVDSDWRTIKTLLERILAKSNWFRDNPNE
jgi:hypothetical protein